ncbi:MAG: hypothetical protein R3C59_20165 [Planctomycetaceae bacterium]
MKHAILSGSTLRPCRSLQPSRPLFVGGLLLISLLVCDAASAQPPGQRTMGRYGWRWHPPQTNGNTTFVMPLASTGLGYWPGMYGYNPYFGNLPYVGYPYIGAPVYSGAAPFYGSTGYYGSSFAPPTSFADAALAEAALLRAQSNAVRSQAQAAASQAEAAAAVEQARAQYLDNLVRFKEIRADQQAAADAREQQRKQERRESAARYQPPAPTERYVRLASSDLNSKTGEINWPTTLQRPEFASGRAVIERTLRAIAKDGPTPELAGQIQDTANDMKLVAEKLLAELGFKPYRDTREFLGRLSVEGFYALEGK